MVDTCVLYLGTIGQYGDDERVINVTPIHKIEASDGVPEDTYPMYGGLCTVDYDADVFVPFEVIGKEDSEVVE